MEGELNLLFFSRGRGRGHAVADIAIVEELRRRRDVSVRFVSYGTGAATFAASGHQVIDLELAERASAAEVYPLAADLIRRLRPPAVVAHEEFGVPAAACLSGCPVLFLTDWFVEPELFFMEVLEDADEVVFLDEPGVFSEPPFLAGKVFYAGPVLRPFCYSRRDRARAREELGLAADALVISAIVPPGRRVEKVAPIFNLLMPAVDLLSGHPKQLVWLAGEDYLEVADRVGDRDDVIVRADDSPFDRLMVASDLVITKGNRNLVLELAALGVPSISISHGLNRIDDVRTTRIPSNRTLPAAELDSAALAGWIERMLAVGPAEGLAVTDGTANAARHVAEFLEVE